MIDAVLGQGLYNFDHEIIHPPPYMDAAAYEGTIDRVRALQPERLLTAHYDVIEGAEVHDFLDASAAFVVRARSGVRAAVKANGTVTLAGLLAELGTDLGPFTSFPNELAGPLRSHLRRAGGRRCRRARAGGRIRRPGNGLDNSKRGVDDQTPGGHHGLIEATYRSAKLILEID